MRDVTVVATLKRLRYLHLNNNQIDVVPDGFANLVELRVLALQHNIIGELSETLFQRMGELQTLALNDNILLAVPKSVGKLVSLIR